MPTPLPVLAVSLFLGMFVVLAAGIGCGPPAEDSSTGEPDHAVHGGDVDLEPLVRGNTAFAIDLYKQLAVEQGNVFLAPHSVSTALAMVVAGARGETESEMADALRLFGSAAAAHPAFASLAHSLEATTQDVELVVANRLWGQKGATILDSYLDTVRVSYGAGFEEIDFTSAAAARDHINGWIAERTKNRIEELFSAEDFAQRPRLVLANAVYFLGAWAEPFDPKITSPGDFHVTPEKDVQANFMARRGSVAYFRSDDFAALELPFEGERLALMILLPNDPNGLPALEAQLSEELLASCVEQMREMEELRIVIPRFQFSDRTVLNDSLTALGMGRAFTKDADFSGMTGERDLFISTVVHEAFIKVDEEGAEAAAATGVGMVRSSIPGEFRADHPFCFLIRDRATGTVLFMGRVAEPVE